MRIRPQSSAAKDREAVFSINEAAFGREDEARLVQTLQAADLEVASLIAEDEGEMIGHILFTWLEAEVGGRPIKAAALAPMAVRPESQNRGVGARLIEAGLTAARQAGVEVVIVLGHPTYYPRFGFSAERAAGLDAPFSGEAFMALELVPGALEGGQGRIAYPLAWGL